MPVYMTYNIYNLFRNYIECNALYNSGSIWSSFNTFYIHVHRESLTYQTISLAWYNMVNNQISCVIVRVIADYHYIHSVIDYCYIEAGNGDYNYLRSFNRLKSITVIINYDYRLRLHPPWFEARFFSSHFVIVT